MSTISATAANLPGVVTAATPVIPASLPSYGSLSGGAVDRLRVAGIPESVIGVANGVVGGVQSSVATMENGGFPVAPTMIATTPAPQAGVAQPVALPVAAPGAANPQVDDALNQPHPQYTGLTQAHVLLLQQVGTPANIIEWFDAQNLNAGELDSWIQTELMQHPEKWDEICGNAAGTARAGLLQLIPNLQLPPPQTTLVTTTPTSTIGISGLPIAPVASADEGKNDLMKMLVWLGVGVGVAFVAYKLLKGRGAGKDEVTGLRAALEQAGQAVRGGGWGGRKGTLAMAAGGRYGGGMAGLGPAMFDQVAHNGAPAAEGMSQVANLAVNYGDNPTVFKYLNLDIMRRLAENPSLGGNPDAAARMMQAMAQTLSGVVR